MSFWNLLTYIFYGWEGDNKTISFKLSWTKKCKTTIRHEGYIRPIITFRCWIRFNSKSFLSLLWKIYVSLKSIFLPSVLLKKKKKKKNLIGRRLYFYISIWILLLFSPIDRHWQNVIFKNLTNFLEKKSRNREG